MNYDITFHPSWWHKNVGICFSKDFFENPKYRMECDIKMRKALYERFGAYGIGEKEPSPRPLLGTDLLAAGYFHSGLLGCEIIYEDNNSPQVVCMGLDEETIEDYDIKDITKHPLWTNMLSQLDYLKATYGRAEIYTNLMGIQNLAMDLMGQELMISYYTAPDQVEKLLTSLTHMSIQVAKLFQSYSTDISGGVTAIIRKDMPNCYVTSNCSVEMISQELYEEFLLKHDQRLADALGCFGIHHCGQTMEHVVNGYAKVKGLKFAEVGAGSDLAAVRQALPHVFLNARYSPARLLNASEEEIRKEVNILHATGNHPAGFSVSCVGIDEQVEDKKILAFLDACNNCK